MKYFVIKNNKMLFWRLGNMNSNKQKHFRTKEGHQPPVGRGIWCFPYPFHDLFFAFHQWEQKLPKEYRHIIGEIKDNSFLDNLTDDEARDYWKKYEEEITKVKKLYKPSKFWYNGIFYSHISPNHISDYDRWFLWDSVKDWAEIAKKHLYSYEKFGNELYKISFSSDHLEIFIPNY